MDIPFVPSQEQEMLRDSVRRWAADRDVRQADAWDKTWPYCVEMGWLMAGVSEEAGGLGGSAFDSAVIIEELGAGLVRAPFVEVGFVAANVIEAVAPARGGELTGGEAVMLFAHDEQQSGGYPEWVSAVAQQRDEQWRISGRKASIVGADRADSFLVPARIDGGDIALFEIEAKSVKTKCYKTIDDRVAGDLILDGSPAVMLAEPEHALSIVIGAFDRALVGESAEALGAMRSALELTQDYLLTRKQYAQAIGDFQALRHRLADMFIELEQARSMVMRGLQALSGSSAEERSLISAATKARVAQAGMFIGAQAIQLHGGIGVTDEYPVGHFFKRLLAFDRRHGGSEAQVQRYAELSWKKENLETA